MKSNVSSYPIRLIIVISQCLSAGALIIEKPDHLIINHEGLTVLTADRKPEGGLVTMAGIDNQKDF